MPKVLLTNGVYEISLMRNMKETRISFTTDDFRIIRTDDVDASVTVDEDGYAYYIFTGQGTTLLGPSEATSIHEQIFELTGKNVCDY